MGPRDLILVVGAAACGSPGATPDAGIALTSAPSAYAAAYCDRVFACCDGAERATRFANASPPVTDISSCRVYVAAVFGNEFVGDTQRAEAAGRARYDEDAMATCMDTMHAASCVDLARVFALMTLPQACPVVRVPLVADGGTCDHDFHCISGLCATPAPEMTGSCAPVPASGAACISNKCGPSGFCDRSGGGAGVCRALGQAGDACTSPLECASFGCSSASPPGVCEIPTTCNGT